MKNFFRLVRYAWPYRGRFWLSFVCAMMVAAMFGANISAVLPLLKILVHHENCRTWMADQVAAVDQRIAVADAQIEEDVFVAQLVEERGIKNKTLQNRYERVRDEYQRLRGEIEEIERRIDMLGIEDPKEKKELARGKLDLNSKRRVFEIAEARKNELNQARDRVKDPAYAAARMKRRVTSLRGERADALFWKRCYAYAQPLVDRYLPTDGFRTLKLLMLLVVLGVVVKGMFQFFQEVLVADIMQLCLFDIRNHFFRRTLALDLASFNQQGSAELMARFTNDMDSLSQGLNTLLTKVIREPLRILSCLSVALWLNWRLTLLALILVPLSTITTVRAGKIMKRAVRRALESMSNIYKILQESFQGIKVVKAYTMERRERIRFYHETKKLYKKSVRVATIDALSDPALELLSFLTIVIALLSGSYLVLRHSTFLDLWLFRIQLASTPPEIVDLLGLYAMLAGISDPVRKLANVHSRIQRAAAASDRICALMDREPTVVDRPSAHPLPSHRQSIEFENVTFGYDERELVIQGFNLSVRHGETIAIVGPNGCGKSTLMSLLPRFWDVHSGSIKIDGRDIRDLKLRDLRSRIGLVAQEIVLFDDTIAANIAYGTPGADRKQIEIAAKRAYAHQFIMSFPEGYETRVGDRGQGLSGGQKQRIALARAMLRDPAILILDEATSAVDIKDEALIRKAIEEFARGRTTFLITHSLATLQFADRIVLMNAGAVEAVGAEDELRRGSQLYRSLHDIHYKRESA
jgi:ABC-type multidrug transport system fused ATPase/permease subunit